MPEKISLRGAKRDSEIPPAVEVNLPGLKGTLPFMAGRAINASGDVPMRVRDEEKRIKEEPIVTPEAELRKAINPPAVVDLEDLPAEKQEEILQSVQEAVTKPAPKPSTFIPRGPGISEAKRMADRVAAQTEEKLKNATQVKQPGRVVPPPAPAPTPEPEPEPKSESGAELKSNDTCIHCGWPVGSKDGCNPTTLDKQVFVAAVLGQRRFSKEYELLGGQMHVTFRSLSVEENDMVIKQLMDDWNQGKISGPAHSVTEATKYQLAIALESVETNIGPIQLPALDGYEFEEVKTGTVLPQLVEYVNKTAMPNEHTRRIISKAYGHFIDTQSKLEAMAENSDFWKATAD
jgi:hypothetical protein